MENNIQILILCGGRGERLKPLTESIPKPLVPIKEKPIIKYLIDHLTSCKMNDFVFATGYQAEKFEEYLRTTKNDFSYQISNAGDVDIIDRIKVAKTLIKNDVIICYGDTLANVDVQALIKYHKTKKEKATVTLWPLKSQFGLMEVDKDGAVSLYEEKPVLDKWINIGYIYLENELLAKTNDFIKFEDFLKYLVDQRELNGFKHRGVHITVNTLQELDDANANIYLFDKKKETRN